MTRSSLRARARDIQVGDFLFGYGEVTAISTLDETIVFEFNSHSRLGGTVLKVKNPDSWMVRRP